MSEHTAENDAAEARRLMALAESHSWYEGDGDMLRVQVILAAAQVYATLASRAIPPARGDS